MITGSSTESTKLIDVILQIDDNRVTLDRLQTELKDSLVVPFIGAGFSIPYGYPGWTDFLLGLAEDFDIKGVDQLINDNEFEAAADQVMQELSRDGLVQKIENTFADHRPMKIDRGPAMVLPGLFKGAVITTNFDRVLEHIFKKSGDKFRATFNSLQAQKAADEVKKGRRILIKLHGDFEHEAGRVLSTDDYDQRYGKGEIDESLPLPRLLRQIATSQTVLFLGCSLSSDRTLQVLAETVKTIASSHFYAVVERPDDDTTRRERFRFLAEHKIRQIWYPEGQHQFVEAILLYLERQKEDDLVQSRAKTLPQDDDVDVAGFSPSLDESNVTEIQNAADKDGTGKLNPWGPRAHPVLLFSCSVV